MYTIKENNDRLARVEQTALRLEQAALRFEQAFLKVEQMFYEMQEAKKEVSAAVDENLPKTGGIELACKITGLKKSTIYKMTAVGDGIPFSKPTNGRLIFISKDLFDWLKTRK